MPKKRKDIKAQNEKMEKQNKRQNEEWKGIKDDQQSLYEQERWTSRDIILFWTLGAQWPQRSFCTSKLLTFITLKDFLTTVVPLQHTYVLGPSVEIDNP